MTTVPDPEVQRQDIWTRFIGWSERLLPWFSVAVATFAPVVVTLAIVPIRSDIPNATVALGLAVIVSLLAAMGTRITAAIAAVSAAVCFDVFFTEPYGSLSISRIQDVATSALLLVGGLIVGQLSARNRLHRGLFTRTSYDLRRIHDVAEMLASGVGSDQVVRAVATELKSLLGLRDCWFEASFLDEPGPVIEPGGAVSWGSLWWGFRTLGLPGKKITLFVEHRGQILGRYVLMAEPATRVSREQLLVAVTLADQAGVSLGLQTKTA
ncbi:MAG: DUF4118 domain-containing protein [Candidatus Dormibacteria bacterium]